jgi:hypothetical protein
LIWRRRETDEEARHPITGATLASQPTLSRFENAVGWAQLRDMAYVLADTVIETHRRRLKGKARRITIDLDPTDDPTHGQQEFAFFNGHYDTWCDLPIVATVTFNAEREQFAVAAVLRPGKAPAVRGARGILRRLVQSPPYVSCGHSSHEWSQSWPRRNIGARKLVSTTDCGARGIVGGTFTNFPG